VNWEALGAVANLLAAIGVIATLIYLAIQIRQNTKAVRSSSIQNLIHGLSGTAQAAVENEYMIPLIRRIGDLKTSVKKNLRGCTSGLS
jgi:hypothetical protein